MAKVKKTAAEPMEQVDGRVDLSSKRTLDEIMGTPTRRYRQQTEAEYRDFLRQLNLTDMQSEARNHSLIPISDRKILEQRLIREFKKTSSRFFGTGIVEQPGELSDAARQILAAGR